MKRIFLIGCWWVIASSASGQFFQKTSAVNYLSLESSYLKKTPSSWLYADRQVVARYSSPWLTTWPGSASEPYWLATTTTQSFNNGKFGTIYYYVMAGNFRQSASFIDIAGKNKRGIKLLLPNFQQRYYSPR